MNNFPDSLFNDLREQFVCNAADRLSQIAHLLDVLEQNPADVDALLSLHRCYHSFAGAGGTFGFPRITSISQLAEQHCTALIESHATVKGVDLSEWRRIHDALRAEFAEGAMTVSLAGQPHPGSASPRDDFNLLVISEDSEIGDALSRMLEEEEMQMCQARTRKEAMNLLAHHLPEGIILDVCLPDGMGYPLVEHVRSLPHGDSPVIMMVSALDGFLDKVEAIRCGADGFFEKPVDWDAFKRRFAGLLERNKPAQARILVVEDDYDQAAYVQALLESAGYLSLVCSNPQFFELVLAAFRPDLILMDAVLPGISGYELVRYLRQSERYSTLPVLFLAAQQQNTGRLESARAGGDDFLAKPVDPELLLTLISVRLDRVNLLRSQMERDGLTRLYNHRVFLEKARAIVAQKGRNTQKSAALILADMDQFRLINDRYSHLAGDRALTTFANFLRHRLRQSDIIARFGGEEFAIIVTNLSKEDAVRLIVRLMEEFATLDHRAPDGSVFKVTFSVGVAMLESDTLDLDCWKQAAADALCLAKAAGRSQVQLAVAGSYFSEVSA